MTNIECHLVGFSHHAWQGEGLKSRLRAGTFIQLTDNDSYQSDVFGSSSFFFHEEIEKLSDVADADVITPNITLNKLNSYNKKSLNTNTILIHII